MNQRERILKILYKKLVDIEIEVLPASFIEFYKPYKYNELIKPLVVQEYNDGKSLTQIANKFQVKKSTVQSIVRICKETQSV